MQTDGPLAWLLGSLDRVSRMCSDALRRVSHTSTLSVPLQPLLDQSEKGNVGESKQLVSFFSLYPLNRLSSAVIIWAKLLRRADKDRGWEEGGEGGLSKKSGGKEPDCFNLSARGAPFS